MYEFQSGLLSLAVSCCVSVQIKMIHILWNELAQYEKRTSVSATLILFWCEPYYAPSNVTRWLEYWFNSWPFRTKKRAKKHKILPKSVQNFAKYYINLPKIIQKHKGTTSSQSNAYPCQIFLFKFITFQIVKLNKYVERPLCIKLYIIYYL